jgi:hypothetical protein
MDPGMTSDEPTNRKATARFFSGRRVEYSFENFCVQMK